MASVEECRAALARATERLMEVAEAHRREHIEERSVSITVSDLDTVFDMRLTLNGLEDVASRGADTAAAPAQIRATVSSDDLVELVDDRMDLGKALLSGRVKLKASLPDLLRLRKLL